MCVTAATNPTLMAKLPSKGVDGYVTSTPISSQRDAKDQGRGKYTQLQPR
jgi:hypothetical protein